MVRAGRSLRFTFLMASVAALGCSEDTDGADKLFKVGRDLIGMQTKLSRTETTAGGPVRVTCTAEYDNGQIEDIRGDSVQIEVRPMTGVRIEGDRIWASEVGTYDVTCNAAEIEGEKPASFSVTAAIGARVIATVDRENVRSGENVNVTCTVEDQHGNEVTGYDPTVRTQPSRGMAINELTLTAGLVGTYQVECAVDKLERVPASVVVTPGVPARIQALLSDYSISAGDRSQVTCSLADAAGNEVQIETTFTVMPIPESVDAAGVSATTAGPHWITCHEATQGLSSEPVLLTVNAGLPARMDLMGLNPAQALYARGDVVEPIVEIFDIYDNRVPTADLGFDSVPAGGVLDFGFNQASLIGDGTFELIVSVTSPTHNNQPVMARTTVTIDGSPPVIEMLFPRRAEIVVGQPGQNITIRGRVTDAVSSVSALEINGNMITPDANGNFTTTMRTAWGVNIIEGAAWDAAGNERSLAQSFEYASRYRRASPSRLTSGRITDGILAHLGQAALDDNNPDVDDLATIARLAIENADVRSLIPNPVTTFNSDCSIPFVTIRGSLRLHVDNVTFGRPNINITAINGGLRLRVDVPNVDVRMRTSGDVCDIGVGVRGNARASRIRVEGDLLISRTGNRISVTMPNRSVNISGLTIDLSLPAVIDWAVDGIINLFRGAISNRLESAFRDVIRDSIPPVIEDFLESISLDAGFNLPAPLSMRLNLNSALGMTRFRTGGGDIGLSTTIYAAPMMTPEPRGGILRENTTTPTFSSQRSLGIGISYDLINQALYSMWYGGGLELDLTQDLLPSQITGVSGMPIDVDASLQALLPPVIRPTGNNQFPLEIQIGDLALDLDLQNVPGIGNLSAMIYASMFIQANVTVDNSGTINLAIGPNPRLILDYMTPLDGVFDLNLLVTAIEDALGLLLPQIVGDVLGGIPIPSFDLSSLSGGFLPPGIVLGLGNATERVHGSYLLLEGSLVQVP